MTLLRPVSVATLLALTAASAVAADTPQPPPSPLAAQALDRLSATRERPLFSPTRRPPPPPPAVVAAPEPPPQIGRAHV